MKNTRKIIYYISLVLLITACIVVALKKFILPEAPQTVFKIENIEHIHVSDVAGDPIKLTDLISMRETSYLYLFKLRDCPPCVTKGFDDLEKMKKAGYTVAAICIGDNLLELRKWGENNSSTQLYMLKTPDFYNHFQAEFSPVLAKLNKGKVKSWFYIL